MTTSATRASGQQGRRIGILIMITLVFSGCVSPPANSAPSSTTRTPTIVSVDGGAVPAVRALVRIRVLACDTLSVGSGFAIDRHRIITNRHVVAGASRISADSWDGRELAIVDTRVSTRDDLAIITVSDELPVRIPLAPAPPAEDTAVRAIGYPLGRALQVSSGTVMRFVDADDTEVSAGFDAQSLDAAGSGAIVFAGEVHHGNSGGPLIDEAGTAVGIVYRKLTGDTPAGLALPSSVVEQNLTEATLIANPDCATAKELFGDI